jgi:hypothetical protein
MLKRTYVRQRQRKATEEDKKTERGKRTSTADDIQGGGVVVSGQAQYPVPVSAAGATNGTDMGSVYECWKAAGDGGIAILIID